MMVGVGTNDWPHVRRASVGKSANLEFSLTGNQAPDQIKLGVPFVLVKFQILSLSAPVTTASISTYSFYNEFFVRGL